MSAFRVLSANEMAEIQTTLVDAEAGRWWGEPPYARHVQWLVEENARLSTVLLKVKELAVVHQGDTEDDLENKLCDIAAEVDGIE